MVFKTISLTSDGSELTENRIRCMSFSVELLHIMV